MKKWRQKEFLTTWECLNCKKSSQLFSWETRSFAKCFRDYILLWASESAKVLFGEPVYVVVQFCSCATCTSPILHLICPAKFCTSIVFNFSWDSFNTQEKWNEKKKKKGYPKVWEANKVLYGRCASGVWFNFYFPLFIIMS